MFVVRSPHITLSQTIPFVFITVLVTLVIPSVRVDPVVVTVPAVYVNVAALKMTVPETVMVPAVFMVRLLEKAWLPLHVPVPMR